MVNRERLMEAIKKLRLLEESNAQASFVCQSMEKEPLDFTAAHVNGIGLVNFPLSEKDVANLITRYPANNIANQNPGRNCCDVDTCWITLIAKGTQKTLPELTYSVVEKMLGISFENLSFNIEAKLKKIIICTNGGAYRAGFKSFNQPGQFGTLLLQVPIEAEQLSGSLVIHNGTRETTSEFGINGSYLVASVAGSCSREGKASFSVHAQPGAITAVMIFDLVWNDYISFCHGDILTPYCFPDLLIQTNEIKMALIPWEIMETTASTTTVDSGHELKRFLYIPIIGTLMPKLTEDSLSIQDQRIVRSLRAIMCLDVSCAVIQPKKEKTQSQGPLFLNITQHPRNIADDLYCQKISDAISILQIGNHLNGDEGLAVEESPFTAIVFRLRNLDAILVSNSSVKEKSVAERFIESLERSLNYYFEKTTIGNPFVLGSLLRELEHLVDRLKTKEDLSGEIVVKCRFFAVLFDICIRLKAEVTAQVLLEGVLNRLDIKQLLVCTCISTGSNCRIDPPFGFANLVTFTNGWQMHPGILTQLTNQLLTEEDSNFGLASSLVFGFLKNDYRIGALETVKLIVEALRNVSSKSDLMNRKFHTNLVSLAIRLQEDQEPNHEMLKLLLPQMKYLSPSQLTELIQHLGKLSKEEKLDCRFFMDSLGKIVIESRLCSFTPQQFLLIAGIYRSIDKHDWVQSFWKLLCLQCIQISNVEDYKKCLFCAILRESKSPVTRTQMNADLKSAEDFKKALRHSLLKLIALSDIFNRENAVEYIETVLLMEETAQLPKTVFIRDLTGLLFGLNPDILIFISNSLIQSQFNLIKANQSTARALFYTLLKHISIQDESIILRNDVKAIVSTFAWFGNIELVQVIVSKLKAAVANKTLNVSTQLLTMLNALSSTDFGSSAASSLSFDRQVFHYLLLECLKTIGQLRTRTSYCVACFELMETAERSFDNSIQRVVADEWAALASTFCFLEIVEIIKAIFNKQITFEGASLKNFPSIWTIFRELCYSAFSKWKRNENMTGLNDSHLTALVQSFFWIAEQKGIADACHLLDEVQRLSADSWLGNKTLEGFTDIHSKVICDKRSVDLATSSVHAVLAFNGLIDVRIHQLNENLMDSVPPADNPWRAARRGTPSPNSAATRDQRLRMYEAMKDLSREVDRLQEIRKEILTKTLTGKGSTLL